jgi:hypothetical protein
MGAKDGTGRFARRQSDIEHIERLRDMIRDAEHAEYIHTNDERKFEGNSLEYIQSVYRCEHLPARIRLYAATRAAEYEPRLADDALLDSLFANRNIMDRLESDSAERCRQSDAKLREWIEAGRVSEEMVVLIRGLFVSERDPPWEPMPMPMPPALLALPAPDDDDIRWGFQNPIETQAAEPPEPLVVARRHTARDPIHDSLCPLLGGAHSLHRG